MSITITDPAFLGRLALMQGMIERKDPDKNTVGRINTMWPEPIPQLLRFHHVDRVPDLTLLVEFAQVGEPVEVVDANGNRIGRFERTWEGRLPPDFKIPFTDEELARRSQDRTGRPLADVIKELNNKYGE